MAERPTITMAERNKMIMDMREKFTANYIKQLKEEHPDWSDSKIRGVAENMAQKAVSQNTQWDVDVVEKGKLVYKDMTLKEKQEYCEKQMATMYPEVKRLEKPHQYYVDQTQTLIDLKKSMIFEHRKQYER